MLDSIKVGISEKIGVNLTVQDLLRQDARIQDLYLNISGMKLSITSPFSVQIVSYLGASDGPIEKKLASSPFKSDTNLN